MDELSVLTWRIPGVDAARLEHATIPAEDAAALRAALERVGAKELVYVATCQRVLFAFHDAPADAIPRLLQAYADSTGHALPEPEALRGRDALRHLAEASASLDSLVLGEPQVLGQFKAAAARCDEQGLAGPVLRHVFSLVFRIAKTVRSETTLFAGKVSLVPLTEELLAQRLAQTASPVVAVLGTGQIGEKMVELVRRIAPAAQVHVVSRDPQRAAAFAKEVGATGHALDAFLETPPLDLDAVAAAIPSPTPILDAARVQALVDARAPDASEPLLLLDLALPRNVEPTAAAVGTGARVKLVQMDELTRMSGEARERREREVEPARAILDREIARVEAEYELRKLRHDLARLARRFDEVSLARLKVAAAETGLDVDDPKFAKWYEQTARALLHEAAEAVKRAGCEERSE